MWAVPLEAIINSKDSKARTAVKVEMCQLASDLENTATR